NIRLTGVPDAIWQRRDRSLAIVDEKTAKVTETQDELAPLYTAQLNGYAYIAERMGIDKASWLGLAYYEPITDIGPDDLADLAGVDSIYMRFAPKVVPVNINLQTIEPMLRRTREVYEFPEPPLGRDDCKDCRLLANLLTVVTAGKTARRGT